MGEQRSEEFITTALFLSRCGQRLGGRNPLPPAQLRTNSWAKAYACFYDALAQGRSLRSFHNSLKASRDQFDSHLSSGRRGWREAGRPKPLPSRDAEILREWRGRSDEELWAEVSAYADLAVAEVPLQVLRDLEAELADEHQIVRYGVEGRTRALVSTVRERSPRLRAAAIQTHGSTCQVCGFDFANRYGKWGEGFIEVHHIRALSLAPADGTGVDVHRDLAVLCANCHRMIHRRRNRALTLDELRAMVLRANHSS